MSRHINGATAVAGVVGRPVRHSLSPIIHNAWLEAAGIDGVYVALSPAPERFTALIDGLRGGAIRGLNVTVPFKENALAVADRASDRAVAAGAANLLVFADDGMVIADNTDGQGLLAAFSAQAPGYRVADAPVVLLGAGGAARGAAVTLTEAGAPRIRVINRSRERAEAIGQRLGGVVEVFDWDQADAALAGAGALINATTLGLEDRQRLDLDLTLLPPDAVVMDMVYRPLYTPLLVRARAAGHPIVDGLEMLIRQAEPSFEAFFGQAPPADVDIRAVALVALEADE